MRTDFSERKIYLNGGEDDGGVGVREAGSDPLTDGLRLAVILGSVVGQRVQDEHLQFNQSIIKIIFWI